MSEECGNCEYNRQCFIKKNVGIYECEKDKEIDRLNNIINELEKILEKDYKSFKEKQMNAQYVIVHKYLFMLEQLKEKNR